MMTPSVPLGRLSTSSLLFSFFGCAIERPLKGRWVSPPPKAESQQQSTQHSLLEVFSSCNLATISFKQHQSAVMSCHLQIRNCYSKQQLAMRDTIILAITFSKYRLWYLTSLLTLIWYLYIAWMYLFFFTMWLVKSLLLTISWNWKFLFVHGSTDFTPWWRLRQAWW